MSTAIGGLGSIPARLVATPRHTRHVPPTAAEPDAVAHPAPDTGGAAADLPAEPVDAWVLVAAAQDGDPHAFAELYHRYTDTVYRYVYFRLADREAAEDLTSETFLRALRRISSVRYQGRDVGAWLVTIARNLVLDHVKSGRYRKEIATAEPSDTAPVAALTAGPQAAGPEQRALAAATRDELLRCLAQLGDDQRECVVLRFVQGLSVTETAELMGRNTGAIKALQHRAIRKLAQLLPPAQ